MVTANAQLTTQIQQQGGACCTAGTRTSRTNRTNRTSRATRSKWRKWATRDTRYILWKVQTQIYIACFLFLKLSVLGSKGILLGNLTPENKMFLIVCRWLPVSGNNQQPVYNSHHFWDYPLGLSSHQPWWIFWHQQRSFCGTCWWILSVSISHFLPFDGKESEATGLHVTNLSKILWLNSVYFSSFVLMSGLVVKLKFGSAWSTLDVAFPVICCSVRSGLFTVMSTLSAYLTRTQP